jgi:O-antigen ligase
MDGMQQVNISAHRKAQLLMFAFLIPLAIFISIAISQGSYYLALPIIVILFLVVGMVLPIEYIALMLLVLPLFAAILKFYLPTFYGLGVNAVMVPFALIILVFRYMMNPNLLSKRIPALPFIVLYLAAYALSLLQTDQLFGGIRVFINTLNYFVILAIMYSVTNRKNFRRLLLVLLISMTPSILVAAVQAITGRVSFGGIDMTAFRSREMEGTTVRIVGLEHMSELSVKCAFVITVLTVLITSHRTKIIWRTLGLIFIGLTSVVLLKTYSREGWLALLVMMGAYTLRYKRILFVIFVGAVLISGIAMWGELAQRVEPIIYGTDSSIGSRSEAIVRTFYLIKQKPVLGYGLGTSAVIDILPQAAAYIRAKAEISGAVNPTHSFYLEEWFYTGIFGVLFSLCIIITIFIRAKKVYSIVNKSNFHKYREIAFVFLITVILAFFQNLLGHTKTPHLWFFWGICLKIPSMINEELHEHAIDGEKGQGDTALSRTSSTSPGK